MSRRKLIISSNQQYGELCRNMMLRNRMPRLLRLPGGRLRIGRERGRRDIDVKRIRMIGRMIVSMTTRRVRRTDNGGDHQLKDCDREELGRILPVFWDGQARA
jgi:hypothetical protein